MPRAARTAELRPFQADRQAGGPRVWAGSTRTTAVFSRRNRRKSSKLPSNSRMYVQGFMVAPRAAYEGDETVPLVNMVPFRCFCP